MHVDCGDGARHESPFKRDSEFHSCVSQPDLTISRRVYSYAENVHLTYRCWFLLSCAFHLNADTELKCRALCQDGTTKRNISLSSECSPEAVIFPRRPLLEGHIRFVYSTNRTAMPRRVPSPLKLPLLDLACFELSRTSFVKVTKEIDNRTCTEVKSLGVEYVFELLLLTRSSLQILSAGNETHCHHASLFHCPGTSKCISKQRLVDEQPDCRLDMSMASKPVLRDVAPWLRFSSVSADEVYNESCASETLSRFPCTSESECLSSVLHYDGTQHCRHGEDEEYAQKLDTELGFSFSRLCNGLAYLNENHGEETDGADERYCRYPWCPMDRHPCISPENHTLLCLPFSRVSDGSDRLSGLIR